MTRTLATGDVIAEIDDRGRFVDLWVVTMVHLHGPSNTVLPYKVRRACRARGAIEDWGNRPWRFAEHAHAFVLPPSAA